MALKAFALGKAGKLLFATLVLVYLSGFTTLAASAAAAATPRVIGGAVAAAADFPATFTVHHGQTACTGSFLSSQTLLTAARCLSSDGASVYVTVGGQTHTGVCSINPDYWEDQTNDYALCYFQSAVSLAFYERLLTDSSKVKAGAVVTLCGTGCSSSAGGSGDGRLRCGAASVAGLPLDSNDLTTTGGASYCYGDTGGPAFLDVDGSGPFVVGINRTGNLQRTSQVAVTYSVLGWVRSWAESYGLHVCGLDQAADGCRTFTPPAPTPTPTPTPTPGGTGTPPPDCRTEMAYLLDAQERLNSSVTAMKACLNR